MILADRNKLKSLELEKFSRDFDNIENQYLNLIYDPIFDRVVERYVYEQTIGMMEWKCAICNKDIFVDKNRIDVENFVCESCKEHYNNKNPLIDKRILDSRTKMFKYIEDNLYNELEDRLKGGK